MTSQTKLQWCAMLAKLVSPMEPERAAKAFADMLPLLPEGDDRYTRRMLERAAKIERKTAVPTFEDLAKAFEEEWRESLPVEQRMGANPGTLRIAEPAWRGPSSDDEREAIRAAAAAYKAEVAAKEVTVERPSVTPSYLSGAALAIARSKAGMPLSPELRALLPEGA